MNQFGQRVRQLRQAKGLSLRELAPEVGVGFTYLSKGENGRLDFDDYPSETLIRRLAETLVHAWLLLWGAYGIASGQHKLVDTVCKPTLRLFQTGLRFVMRLWQRG